MLNVSLDVPAGELCIQCEGDAEGSAYWLQMSPEDWKVVRPQVVQHFKKGHTQNILFVPKLCKPFCSSKCSINHKELYDGETSKTT